MKKILKIFVYVLLGLFLIGGILVGTAYLRQNNYLFFATGSNEKAFLNSTWLMSRNEVARANANDSFLNKTETNFYRFFEPGIVNKNRYSSYTQEDLSLWGYQTKIEYIFFDDKLYQYRINIDLYDRDTIEKTILNALNEKYGKQTEIKDKSKYLISEYKWNPKNQKVRYWISKKDSI